MEMQGSEGSDWRRLYEELRSLLMQYGTESAVGRGDFWVVDDDWGYETQKICIFNARLLTKPLARQVQCLLRDRFATWRVMFQLEVEDNEGELLPPEGVIVYPDKIKEDWDENFLSRSLGDAFVWPLS